MKQMFGRIAPWLILAATAFAAGPAAAATTYNYVTPDYSFFYETCAQPGTAGNGSCQTFTTSMHVSGWFSLDTPLPPNFGPTDISTRPDLRWSFSDGFNTYSSTDAAHAYIPPGGFVVQTDGAGVPLNQRKTVLEIDLWQTTPGLGNYFDFVNIGYSPGGTGDGTYAVTSVACTSLNDNICEGWGGSTYSYANISAMFTPTGVWSISTAATSTASAPMLGRWALLMLLGGLLLLGRLSLRRVR